MKGIATSLYKQKKLKYKKAFIVFLAGLMAASSAGLIANADETDASNTTIEAVEAATVPEYYAESGFQKKDDGNIGYLDSRGNWIKNQIKAGTYNGRYGFYYFNSRGNMVFNSWIKSNGKWYYFGSNGTSMNGWNKIGGKWYYMRSYVMQTGWQYVSGKWYYMNGSGAMQTGWQYLSWSSGRSWFYFNGNGAMQTGWRYINGSWYYMNGNGAMLTGWQRISGKWYYFYSSGKMASNTYIGKYHINSNGVWDR